MSKNTWYLINARSKPRVRAFLYDDIGGFGISAQTFVNELKAHQGGEIEVHINSLGGSVFDGLAIYNFLRTQNATVHIDGVAASIASVIAMAGKKVRMGSNTFMMVHNPYTTATGDSDQLRNLADTMEKIRDALADTYVKKSSADQATVLGWMNSTKWFNAGEAKAANLIDEISEECDMKACAALNWGRMESIPGAMLDLLKNRKPDENADLPGGAPIPLARPGLQTDGLTARVDEAYKAHMARVKNLQAIR